MKTMTCKQMGGTCDTPISGKTPEGMMANGAKHLAVMAADGDMGHKKILDMMEEMKTNPASGKDWYEKFVETFNAQPEK
jgi:hypothetical protein